MKDYYNILGVKFKATKEEIRTAFKRLALQYHPDKNNGQDLKFKEINEAYQILYNDITRKDYDDKLFYEYSQRYANNYSNNKSNKVQRGNFIWYKDKVFFMSAIIVLFFVFSLFSSENNTNNPPISTNTINNIQDSSPVNYITLDTGFILKINKQYLSGLGEINIENNSNEDSLAKLVRLDTKSSIYTVYIKAKSKYTIKGINNGIYDLYFSSGLNWDNENQKFLKNNYYSKFEEHFDFITKKIDQGDRISTEYTIFNVTLDPVIGGTAETNSVSEIEFSNY